MGLDEAGLTQNTFPKRTGPTTSFVTSLAGCSCFWLQWPRHNEDKEHPIKMEARSYLNYKLLCQMLILGVTTFLLEE